MKILSGIDIPFNPFGGSPIICNDWYSNLPKGYEVSFLTMPTTNQKWWSIPNVHFLKTKKVTDPIQYPAYINELNSEVHNIISSYQPDIIHMQHLNFGLSRSFVEVASTIPKIGICHGTDTQVASTNSFFKENLIKITDGADILVFPTEQMAKDLFSLYGREKVYKIIKHGLPPALFSAHNIHMPDMQLRLLYAGRLNHYKGADIVINALSHLNFKVKLDVIGDEDERGFRQKLEQIVIEKDLGSQVNFHEKISREDLWNKYSEYDCIVIPSRSLEAFSLTAVEAQARGLVVIYGNGGGIREVIGESGLCISDNDPETLAAIISEVNKDRNVLAEYRLRGYENAKRYRLEDQIVAILNLSENEIVKRRTEL